MRAMKGAALVGLCAQRGLEANGLLVYYANRETVKGKGQEWARSSIG